MIPSGYDIITNFTAISLKLSWRSPLSPSMRTRLQTPTRWLPFSPCMFLHFPSSVQGYVSHDRSLFVLLTLAQRSSIRHTFCTVELQQFLQRRRWRTERRYGLSIFFPSPPYINSGVFFQVREPARTPSNRRLTGGRHTGHNNKCARGITMPL